MIFRVREPVELTSVLETHGNIVSPRQLHNFFHPRILPTARNHNAVKRPPRLKRLPHCMYPRQSIHRLNQLHTYSQSPGVRRSCRRFHPVNTRTHNPSCAIRATAHIAAADRRGPPPPPLSTRSIPSPT